MVFSLQFCQPVLLFAFLIVPKHTSYSAKLIPLDFTNLLIIVKSVIDIGMMKEDQVGGAVVSWLPCALSGTPCVT